MPRKPTPPTYPKKGSGGTNAVLPPGGRLPPLNVTGTSKPIVPRPPLTMRTESLEPLDTLLAFAPELTDEQRERLFLAGGDKFSQGLIANLNKLQKYGFPKLHAEMSRRKRQSKDNVK